MQNFRLLLLAVRESRLTHFLSWVTVGVTIIFASPISLVAKVTILSLMNFFILLAASVVYFVLSSEYLKHRVMINLFTLLMTLLAFLMFFNQVVGVVYTAAHFQFIFALLKSFISATTIISYLVTHYTAWILLRIAYEGSVESEYSDFSVLYKGIVSALVLLKLVFITVAIALHV